MTHKISHKNGRYRYVALLRGINVGGNNIVSMSELRACFEDVGFSDVSTYINSGNVLFSSDEKSIDVLILLCEKSIKKIFNLAIRVVVISADQLERVMTEAPNSWGHDILRKHNLLFVRPPVSSQEVMNEISTVKSEIETVTMGDGVVYWSASLEQFGRTASSKLASNPVYQVVTVRNYNTSFKLLDLLQKNK